MAERPPEPASSRNRGEVLRWLALVVVAVVAAAALAWLALQLWYVFLNLYGARGR